MEVNGLKIEAFADLRARNLRGTDLYGTDLRGANLRGADLHGTDLYGANLYGADLRGANLYGADLRGADLRGTDLLGANLYGANLSKETKVGALALAQTSIVPESGAFDGWKKCEGGVLVRVRIPDDARRSNATGRKCRAEFVDVIEIVGPRGGKHQEAISSHDRHVVYRVGERVTAHEWCADRFQECAGGIHFFLTRVEAENY